MTRGISLREVARNKQPEPDRVWILTEEIESGTYHDASTYVHLSVHRSATDAETAGDDWRSQHTGAIADNHPFASGEGELDEAHWCAVCRCGVFVEEIPMA